MTFAEYAQIHFNKAMNKQDIVITTVDKSTDRNEFDVSKTLDPNKWSAKIVNDKKYLFFNGKYLNISSLRKEIKNVYSQNGYENYGFSKLDESELIRYKTLKDILVPEFFDDVYLDELDASKIALKIFNNELKEFEWKPEPLTMKI